MRRVALLTPTHRADIERFDLLCESIDRRVSGYDRHYVIVNDEDMSLFGRYGTERRVVQPASKFLPAWLWAMPRFCPAMAEGCGFLCCQDPSTAGMSSNC